MHGVLYCSPGRRRALASGNLGGRVRSGRAAPQQRQGAARPVQTSEELVVTRVRHHLIRDRTGLERLDPVAETRAWQVFVGRRLGKAHDPGPEPALGVLRQGGDALAVAGLVRRLAGTRNASIQSESRQERYRKYDK